MTSVLYCCQKKVVQKMHLFVKCIKEPLAVKQADADKLWQKKKETQIGNERSIKQRGLGPGCIASAHLINSYLNIYGFA